MIRYIANRLFYGLLVLMGATVIVFFIFNVLPGDPVAMLAGQRTDVATREAIAKDLGLLEPLPTQLYLYVRDLSPISIHEDSPKEYIKYNYKKLFGVGNNKFLVIKTPYLRRSFTSGKKVSEIIWENLEGTFWLALAAMLFATIFGVLLGVIASLKQNSLLDNTMVSISVIGISAPSFVLGAIVSMVFGSYLREYTGLDSTGNLWEYELEGRSLMLKNIILPAFTLGLRPLAIIVQLTRSSMLDVLSQDYIRTAKAKGLPYYMIITKHALKNALNPVITAVSGWLASLMAGAFFVEVIFGWKGLGLVTIDAVKSLDFPIVMGVTIFVAFAFILINIFVDLLYALIDPRVRIK